MLERLINYIMIHTSQMDYALSATIKLIKFAQIQDIESVESSLNNRERLINQIAELQGKAEGIINSLPNEYITKENVEIIKAWFEDLSIWSDTMAQLDQYLLKFLEEQKDELNTEIASLFKSKTKFKGYNLNDVSK